MFVAVAVSVGLITISLWIVMAGFGGIVSFLNLAVAREDLKYQIGKTEKNKTRALIAKVNIANELMRCVVLILLFIAGVLVASVQFSPDPPPASLYVRGVILLTIAVLVTNTLLHRWLRRKLKTRPVNEAVSSEPTEVTVTNPEPILVTDVSQPEEMER